MSQGFRLFRVAGTDVFIDWSVAIIFLLVATSLGSSIFPYWHPEWSRGLDFALAVASAVVLLASILAHEFAHAIVGRVQGLHVDRITLFIFGGVAQLRHEPRRWSTELLMALAGPMASLVIGASCLQLAVSSIRTQAAAPDAYSFLSSLSPGTTVTLWLAQINLMLAAFNLLPGFPLDGGRALRALLWWRTHDLRRSTHVATSISRMIAALLITAGIAMVMGLSIPLLGRGIVGGAWLALLGLLLHSAAVMSYRQSLIRSSFEDVPVASIMRRQIDAVPEDLSVQQLVDEHLLGSQQGGFPVVRGDQFVGMVGFDEVQKLPRSEWSRTSIRDILIPLSRVHTIHPTQNAADAWLELDRDGARQLPVVDHGHVQGLLSREDMFRALSLSGSDPALTS